MEAIKSKIARRPPIAYTNGHWNYSLDDNDYQQFFALNPSLVNGKAYFGILIISVPLCIVDINII